MSLAKRLKMQTQGRYPQSEDVHQQAVYRKAQELLRDRTILVQALSEEGMEYLNSDATERYIAELANMVIADDADNFGRQLLDQVIHYVWAIAEQQVTRELSVRAH